MQPEPDARGIEEKDLQIWFKLGVVTAKHMFYITFVTTPGCACHLLSVPSYKC